MFQLFQLFWLSIILLNCCCCFSNVDAIHNHKDRNKIRSDRIMQSLLRGERKTLYDIYRQTEDETNIAFSYTFDWLEHSGSWFTIRYPDVEYCNSVEITSPFVLHYNNLYWQVLTARHNAPENEIGAVNGTMNVFLFNAYYDNRVKDNPFVRIITSTDRQVDVEKREWWCLLWFDNLQPPIKSDVVEVVDIWPTHWAWGRKNGAYGPQIMSCKIPYLYRKQVPRAVSLTEYCSCQLMPKYPTNILRVIYNQKRDNSSKEPSIGVCVKALRLKTYETSVRVIEWLEMVRILGADKVYFYALSLNDNIQRVLNHYSNESFIEWRRLTLPGNNINIETLYSTFSKYYPELLWPQELLELNDCFYRNMFRHDYLAIFDFDEMIIPHRTYNWHQLLHNANHMMNRPYTNYISRHAYAYPAHSDREATLNLLSYKIPDYLYMMQHTYRARMLPKGENVKCFHRTDRVAGVHNHMPMKCLDLRTGLTTPHCSPIYYFDSREAILMHYRVDRSPPNNCTTDRHDHHGHHNSSCMVHDTTAWRYFRTLERKVSNKLYQIFLKQTNR